MQGQAPRCIVHADAYGLASAVVTVMVFPHDSETRHWHGEMDATEAAGE